MQFYIVNMTLLGNLFWLQHIDRWYSSATRPERFEFKFTSGKIELVFEDAQMMKDNWTIYLTYHPCIVRVTLGFSLF